MKKVLGIFATVVATIGVILCPLPLTAKDIAADEIEVQGSITYETVIEAKG